jgi:hypothetical protein
MLGQAASLFWLTDSRGAEVTFEIHTLGAAAYERQPPDVEGWRRRGSLHEIEWRGGTGDSHGTKKT